LLNASQQLGGSLGLAIFTAVATSRTQHLLATHTPAPQALTSGFSRALTVGSVFILASAVIALRATNTRGEAESQPSIGGSEPSATDPVTRQTMPPTDANRHVTFSPPDPSYE
jgi:hypothetical protein